MRKSNSCMLLLTIIILNACVVAINENNYRLLSDKEKSHFRKYSNKNELSGLNNSDSLIIYEICAENIKSITRKQNFTWVHIWVPYCKGTSCSTILGDIKNGINKYSKDNFGVILASNSYSWNDIKNSVVNSRIQFPVFVLSDSCFGHKQGGAMKKLARELDNNHLIRKNEYFNDYLFQDTLLVKACWNISLAQIDSIIKNKFNP